MINPRQVRDFAKSLGLLAKTDALDAQVVAQFAQRVRPTPRPLPDAQAQELSALLTRRRQLIQMRTAEENHLGRTAVPALRQELQEHLAWLEAHVRRLDDDLGNRLQESPLWREKEDLLKGVPGVGPVLCWALLAQLPELGGLDREADCRPGGCCACQPRQWPPQRPTPHPGRKSPGPLSLVHGDRGLHSVQPRHPSLLSAPLRPGETKEGRPGRFDAQVPDHLERHAQTPDPMESPPCS